MLRKVLLALIISLFVVVIAKVVAVVGPWIVGALALTAFIIWLSEAGDQEE